LERATETARKIQDAVRKDVTPFGSSTVDALTAGLRNAKVVICAGAGGARLLPSAVRKALPELKVAIDLNAIPPLGVEGIEATDRDADREGVRSWGALGVGRTKMKIHKKAVQELFTSPDKVLDAEEILAIGRALN
jgi:hypothetical protein